MSDRTAGQQHHHQADGCRCVVSGWCLREVRRRRMVSLEAVTKLSGYTHEQLSRVERGESGACVDGAVLRAYETAMEVTVESEVFTMVHEIMGSLGSALEMLSRLYWARDGRVVVREPQERAP